MQEKILNLNKNLFVIYHISLVAGLLTKMQMNMNIEIFYDKGSFLSIFIFILFINTYFVIFAPVYSLIVYIKSKKYGITDYKLIILSCVEAIIIYYINFIFGHASVLEVLTNSIKVEMYYLLFFTILYFGVFISYSFMIHILNFNQRSKIIIYFIPSILIGLLYYFYKIFVFPIKILYIIVSKK